MSAKDFWTYQVINRAGWVIFVSDEYTEILSYVTESQKQFEEDDAAYAYAVLENGKVREWL